MAYLLAVLNQPIQLIIHIVLIFVVFACDSHCTTYVMYYLVDVLMYFTISPSNSLSLDDKEPLDIT